MSDFAHLHVHTEYSMLDGASRIDGLMARAAQHGMRSLAITDHGVMFGAVDFYRAGLRHGVKPIIGCEVYVAEGDRTDHDRTPAGKPYYHLVLLAETQTGYRNLMKLVSRAYLEGFWYKPRVDRELLAEYAEGIICLSGCLGGEVNQHLIAGDEPAAVRAAEWYRSAFGADSYFIELQDHGIPEQKATNPVLIRIADRLEVGLVVTNDSHYTDRADYDAHDSLLCVQTGAEKDDEGRFKFHNDEFYVKSADEMCALFADRPDAAANTVLIAERCNVEIDFDTMHLPSFDCPDGLSEADHLRALTMAGAMERYGSPLPVEAQTRIDYELGVIEQMGYSAYFLIVADLVAHARAEGIRVGPGRGSAAGCAVAYSMGITGLDPIVHGLIFERFLNPDRVSMPDIDIDFDDRRRGEMIDYVSVKYGADRVAQIVTFSTIKAKQAIKDSARLLGHPYGLGDRLSKMMPAAAFGKTFTLDQAREMSRELRDAWRDPVSRDILDMAGSLEGLRRQHGVHAAGVVIGADPITEHCPVLRQDDGPVVTQYDGGMVESIGLLKMDFLGLRTLTVLTDALAHVGGDIDLDGLPLDDPAVFEMLRAGDTDGVFQMDSAGITALVRQLQPDSFDDIVALLALYRPGPMGEGLHIEYAERKHGRSLVTYPHPDLEPVLAPTFGIIVYQEQVLQIAQTVAGFTLGEADLLRRAIGKKDAAKMGAVRDQFLAGCVRSGYTAVLGGSLWDSIEKFADYAFNKSHSAAYGLISYQTAWLKVHYPAEFMAALLSSVKNDPVKLPGYLHSARQMGLKVLPPDVNESGADFSPVGDRIRFGLAAVRNVGVPRVDAIVAARGSGPFTDFADWAGRVDGTVLNRRVVASLVRAGAFDFAHPREGLSQVCEQICAAALKDGRRAAGGEVSLFADAGGLDEVRVPDVEWDRATRMQFEREMLGLYVSDHPLFGLDGLLGGLSSVPVGVLAADGVTPGVARVQLAGLLSGVTVKYSRGGATYATATLEDLRGGVELLVLPRVFARLSRLLVDDLVALVDGRMDGDEIRVLVDGLVLPDLADLPRAPGVV